MARKLREWYPHTCYHITSRGNRRSDIFKEEADFDAYLKIVSLALAGFEEKSPYELICYCLMDNHVHLLIQTSTQPLGPLMKKINMNYAIYFNKKYNYVGYLHQDRFHADRVQDSSHLLTVSRYIHLNPVAANMVDLPEEYRYSSYRSFIAMETCDLVSKERVLSHFAKDCASKLYQEFVESKIQKGKG
ncbi:MAG TPA: transposase [Epulopiscium sp.]|nr:transposase [Candidatus Epulonipiscium sp.]